VKFRPFPQILAFLILTALSADSSSLVIGTSYFAFSPNGDGIQDEIEVRFLEIPSSLETPADYALRIENDRSLVRTIRADLRWIRPRRAVSNLFLPFAETVRPLSFPESIPWDGRDDAGKILPDGNYRITVTAADASGRVSNSNSVTVELSTRRPQLTLSADVRAIVRGVTQDGKPADSTKGEFAISQSAQADPKTVFTGRIVNAAGEILETRTWPGTLSPKIIWNGRTAKGDLVPWGCYTYWLEARSPAGVVVRESIPGLLVVTELPQIDLQPDESFSPNGDSVKDKIQFLIQYFNQSLRAGVKSYRLQILTHDSPEIIYDTQPQRVLPGILVWDGKNAAGAIVKDGIYDAKLTLETTQGTVSSAPRSFRVDTSPPGVSFSSSSSSFSPDGDGEEEDISFKMDAADISGIEQWTIRVLVTPDTQNRFQKLIRTWQGAALPERIMWNGLSDAGEPIESLETFTVVLEARDRAGNLSKPEKLVVRSKTLLRPVAPGQRALYARIPVQKYFNADSTLTSQGEAAISDVLSHLSRFRKYNIHLYVNSGLPGGEEQNLEITERRALQLYKRMQGSWKDRMDFQGLGESEILNPSPDDFSQYRNERIELQLYVP